MEQLFKLPMRGAASFRDGLSGRTFWFIVRASDVLIVLWILDGGLLYAYLVARILSLIVPCSLSILEAKASPQLSILVSNQSLFQAAAARINLGYLMVSGAVALLVLLMATRVAALLGIAEDSFREILIWLLIGQISPVLFGAARLLMQVMERHVFYDLITLVTAALFLAGVILMPTQNAVSVAQALAAAQLAQAGICALILTQSGVWPGLTALLHKEIKLF